MPVVWSITPATSPFERARTEMLRQHNFHQQQLLSEQVAFVVRRMTVDYLAPARLDEQLEVRAKSPVCAGLLSHLLNALSILTGPY